MAILFINLMIFGYILILSAPVWIPLAFIIYPLIINAINRKKYLPIVMNSYGVSKEFVLKNKMYPRVWNTYTATQISNIATFFNENTYYQWFDKKGRIVILYEDGSVLLFLSDNERFWVYFPADEVKSIKASKYVSGYSGSSRPSIIGNGYRVSSSKAKRDVALTIITNDFRHSDLTFYFSDSDEIVNVVKYLNNN